MSLCGIWTFERQVERRKNLHTIILRAKYHLPALKQKISSAPFHSTWPKDACAYGETKALRELTRSR